MVISSDTLIKSGDWAIVKLYRDGEFKNYVLRHEFGNGKSSNPFDTVTASGGLLQLNRNGERSVTFSDVIDGKNRYREDTDMPREIFETLKEIGPY